MRHGPTGIKGAEGVTNLKISTAAKKSKLRSSQAFGLRSVGGQPMGGVFEAVAKINIQPGPSSLAMKCGFRTEPPFEIKTRFPTVV